jgi:hypothetical protein
LLLIVVVILVIATITILVGRGCSMVIVGDVYIGRGRRRLLNGWLLSRRSRCIRVIIIIIARSDQQEFGVRCEIAGVANALAIGNVSNLPDGGRGEDAYRSAKRSSSKFSGSVMAKMLARVR